MEKIHCQRESRYRRDREQMYKRQRGDTLEIEKICREQMQMRQTENRCIRDREQMSDVREKKEIDSRCSTDREKTMQKCKEKI